MLSAPDDPALPHEAMPTDTIPPTLSDVFVDRARVAVLNRRGLVVVSAELADDDSGVITAFALFSAPTGAPISGLVLLDRVAGRKTDGTWSGTLEILPNTGIGTWTLALLHVQDAAGNAATWRDEDLEALGLATTFEVVWSG